MAAEINVDDNVASRLTAATKEGDGITAKRILEEVGSCGWKDLLKQTNKALAKERFTHLYLSSENSSYQLNPDYETLTLHIHTGHKSTPLASTTEIRCEKK